MEGNHGSSIVACVVCTAVSFILGFITEVIFEKSAKNREKVESFQECLEKGRPDIDLDDDMYGY